jgi:hypothetical protein
MSCHLDLSLWRRATNSRRTRRPFFFKCDEACGGWIDMRDLGAVLDHEEPLPHPVSDQAQ